MVNVIDQIEAAILAHRGWKEHLASAIENGSSELTSQAIARDDVCALGQWLYGGAIPASEKNSSNYAKVETWHAAFHKEAAYIIDLVRQKKLDEAREAMTQEGRRYFQVSVILVGLLEEWKERLLAEQA